MPPEQITKVDFRQVWRIFLDQVKLFDKLLSSVLKGHLGVYVEHALNTTGFHIMVHSQIVKEADHRLGLLAEKPTAFNALKKVTNRIVNNERFESKV